MKSLVLVISLLFLFGCGGSNGSKSGKIDVSNNNNNLTLGDNNKYDLWEYLVSNKTVTKYFDSYEADSNYVVKSNRDISRNNMVRVEEIVSPTKVKIITNDDDGSNIESMIVSDSKIIEKDDQGFMVSSFNRYSLKIEDGCNFVHHDSYSPISGYTFKDVLNLNCDGTNNLMTFSKHNGIVASRYIKSSELNGVKKTSYSVSVISNIDNNSIARQQVEKKLLNEGILGYWTTHVYDQNDRVSSMMDIYTFNENGTVLVANPYGSDSHTEKWEYKNGKIKIFLSLDLHDSYVELEPIQYESEINKVIRMKYRYSSGGTGFYAWDKF